MSWFTTEGDTRVDTEVADGVLLERRSVLWLPALGVASLLGGGLAAQGKKGGGGALTFAAFLAEVYPQARALLARGGAGEEAYLMQLAAVVSRIAEPGAEVREAMAAFRREHGKEGERFPLAIVSFRLAPGRGFSHHDHRDYNGVIMGLEGEVRVRNYDILGDKPVPPKGETFRIRETRNDLILPGRFSTLGRRRENVHDLVAGPDGARVLDVFTFFDAAATSYWLDVEDKARDADKRIYDAAWK